MSTTVTPSFSTFVNGFQCADLSPIFQRLGPVKLWLLTQGLMIRTEGTKGL